VNGYKQQAEWMRAMAHPTRLRILEILAQRGECCVCHITAILRRRQPYVSQHLMVLRSQGLVADRKDGAMVYYHLADARIADLISLSRQVLLASGAEAQVPHIPEPPVRGCPCPECAARSS
jgi:ArsR family transcriptional regulator